MKTKKNILIIACFFAKYTSPAQSSLNFGLTPIPPRYSLYPILHIQGLLRTGLVRGYQLPTWEKEKRGRANGTWHNNTTMNGALQCND
jgi:hypothetical protein